MLATCRWHFKLTKEMPLVQDSFGLLLASHQKQFALAFNYGCPNLALNVLKMLLMYKPILYDFSVPVKHNRSCIRVTLAGHVQMIAT